VTRVDIGGILKFRLEMNYLIVDFIVLKKKKASAHCTFLHSMYQLRKNVGFFKLIICISRDLLSFFHSHRNQARTQ